MHHSVTFNFGSAKVFSPAIFERSFSYDKCFLIAATDYYNYVSCFNTLSLHTFSVS